MNTLIYLFFEIGSFLMLTLLLHKSLLRYNRVLVIVCYFGILWLTAELFNQVHIWLRHINVFIELGHASIFSIILLLLFHIVGLAVILWNVLKTKKA